MNGTVTVRSVGSAHTAPRVSSGRTSAKAGPAPRSSGSSRPPRMRMTPGGGRPAASVIVVGVPSLEQEADDELGDDDHAGAHEEAVPGVEGEAAVDAEVRVMLDERVGGDEQREHHERHDPQHSDGAWVFQLHGSRPFRSWVARSIATSE